MDNLFAEGLLQPVNCESADAKLGWISVGVRRDPDQENLERFQHLLALVESSVPGAAARHSDWQRFAARGLQFIIVTCSVQHGGDDLHEGRFRAVRERVDAEFTVWMLKRFGSLHNLPSSPPIMVHHIPRHLAHAPCYKNCEDCINCDGMGLALS